jgi:NADP-dependent 3-hydroxy acid dehydrogenase YdfG
MKTVVMTGGTAGFGAIAAKRISDAPNTKLILGARDTKNSSIDALPLDLARLANVRSFGQALTKKLALPTIFCSGCSRPILQRTRPS